MSNGRKPRKASRSKGRPAEAQALSPRMERFVLEYLAEPQSAAAAYSRAGYKAQGDAARTAAARLLKHPAVGAGLEAARAELE